MARIYNELHNYQNVPRELVFDKDLSDRARFVYVFMACKPDDWDFYLEPMAKDIGYSVDTLRKYINELVASGWLVKGEQTNENGVFGAVEYTLKATKFTDTENFRHGKNQPQDNIDDKKKIDCKEEKNEIDESISKKSDELFETCWLAYRRKGSKKKAKEYWNKLKDDEKECVLPHIKAYVSSRDITYQKDFERYLRDKIFLTIVFNKNQVVYDPTKKEIGNEYLPETSPSLMWNDYYGCYMYLGGFYDGHISDGYDDKNRPDGASITLNNGRGTIKWDAATKKWVKDSK